MKKTLTILLLSLILSFPLQASIEFEEFFQKHNAILLVIDPNSGQILDANEAALKFYGYSLAQIKELKIQQINQFSKEQVEEEIAQAKQEDRSYFIFRHATAQGEIKTVEVRSHPYMIENQEVLISLIQDITKQRLQQKDLWQYQQNLEEMVAQQTQKLLEASRSERNSLIFFIAVLLLLMLSLLYLYIHQSRLKTKFLDQNKEYKDLLNAATDIAIIATDTKGVIQNFNIGAQKMLGYKAKEVVGKKTPMIFHDKQQLQSFLPRYLGKKELLIEWIEDALQKKKNYNNVIFYTKQGNSFYGSVNLSKITNSQNTLKGYLGIIEDRSKELAYKQQLERLNAHLKEEVQTQVEQIAQKDKLLQEQSKLAAMGEMISAIAHQWRQPLNALSINIQNLDDDYEDGLIDEEFIEEFIQNQTKTIGFMSKTIDDFRNFFKTDKEKKEFSILEVVENVHALLKGQLDNYSIEFKIEGEDIIGFGYKNEFQQALLNILNNSKDALIEHCKDNRYIAIYLDPSNAKITLCDSGGGVKKQLLDRIFEPYYTTKEQGQGTGIGLYMTKIILNEHMDAKIHAYNGDDGLCVQIKLP